MKNRQNSKKSIAIVMLLTIALLGTFVSCDDGSDGGPEPMWSATGDDLSAFNEVGDSTDARGTVGALSFDDLSIETMRAETFGSSDGIVLGQQIGREGGENAYQLDNGTADDSYNSYMAAYNSDGLRVYTRIDIPNRVENPMPTDGYPVVIFGHGWVGDKAGYTFNYTADGWYAPITDAYVDAGFILLFPGFRAHGTVNEVAAEGQEFVDAYDNGSYISPIYYGRDLLHLLEDLDSLNSIAWSEVGGNYSSDDDVKVDLSSIHVIGHSNAGDAIVTALAVSGEGSSIENEITSASVWSGCFPTRYGQVEAYYPMKKSYEAWQAGTGSPIWNGTATDPVSGTTNPNFVHGWPYDWLANDPENTDINTEFDAWNDGWQTGYVNFGYMAALEFKYGEMVDTYNDYMPEVTGLTYPLTVGDAGSTIAITEGADDGSITPITTTIEPVLKTKLDAISAVNYPEYLVDEEILFQYSDRDFYSWQALNEDLVTAIEGEGGTTADVAKFAGHNHELKLSSRAWYRNAGDVVDTALFPNASRNGYEEAIQNGISLARDGIFPNYTDNLFQ